MSSYIFTCVSETKTNASGPGIWKPEGYPPSPMVNRDIAFPKKPNKKKQNNDKETFFVLYMFIINVWFFGLSERSKSKLNS